MTIKKHILLENKKIFENLEVSEELGSMYWNEAIESCKKLGEGWRLPTKEELNVLYENKEKVGGFANTYYWSSTKGGTNGAWWQDFYVGNQNFSDKTNYSYVRAVRAS